MGRAKTLSRVLGFIAITLGLADCRTSNQFGSTLKDDLGERNDSFIATCSKTPDVLLASGNSTTSGDQSTFALVDDAANLEGEVRQIFQTGYCADCHSPTDNSRRFHVDASLTQLAQKQLIDLADPGRSLLYKKVESDEMPMDHEPLKSEEKQKILAWIASASAPASGNEALPRPKLLSEADKIGCISKDLEEVRKKKSRA